jgi:hypothetical protein
MQPNSLKGKEKNHSRAFTNVKLLSSLGKKFMKKALIHEP